MKAKDKIHRRCSNLFNKHIDTYSFMSIEHIRGIHYNIAMDNTCGIEPLIIDNL